MITKGIPNSASVALELISRAAKTSQGGLAGGGEDSVRLGVSEANPDVAGVRRLAAIELAFRAAAGRVPASAQDAFRQRLWSVLADAAALVRADGGPFAGARAVAVATAGEGAESDGLPQPGEAPGPSVERDAGIVSGASQRDGLVIADASRVKRVMGAQGPDTPQVDADRVGVVRGDGGRDRLVVSGDRVRAVLGGEGADRIAVASGDASKVGGGGGSDRIQVVAGEVGVVKGARGNDRIAVAADRVAQVSGGAGEDRITVAALEAGAIKGGKGDDAIKVTALSAIVEGGAGDDAIRLNVEMAELRFDAGDGADTVRIGRGAHLLIDLGPGLSADSMRVEAVEGTRGDMMLRFESGESILLSRANRAASIAVSFADGSILSLKGEALAEAPAAVLDVKL